MSTLAWAVFMLAVTGFVAYVVFQVLRNERSVQDFHSVGEQCKADSKSPPSPKPDGGAPRHADDTDTEARMAPHDRP